MVGAAHVGNGKCATTQTGKIVIDRLDAGYATGPVIRAVSLEIRPCEITALIGPSGCGKSTLLRCLNRMHETVPGAMISGQVLLDGKDIYAPDVDAAVIRRRVGMVFQVPTPLRTRSVYENVAIGLRLGGPHRRYELDERVEWALRRTVLWDDVKDRLYRSALALSDGQQQRLCIARAIAVEPEVVLLDEPTSALDPIAMHTIEALMVDLKARYTIVLVTHNMHQAARVADRTGIFMIEREGHTAIGRLIEFGPTRQIFSHPRDPRTEEYITGRVG